MIEVIEESGKDTTCIKKHRETIHCKLSMAVNYNTFAHSISKDIEYDTLEEREEIVSATYAMIRRVIANQIRIYKGEK